jgi:hypothetical protein
VTLEEFGQVAPASASLTLVTNAVAGKTFLKDNVDCRCGAAVLSSASICWPLNLVCVRFVRCDFNRGSGNTRTMRRATKRFLRQLKPKQIFKENGLNEFRLGWRGVLCVMACTAIFSFLFDSLGHFELVLPVIFSSGVIAIAVAFRWQLRHHLWFWAVVAITVALHALVIVYQSWTTTWVPAAVLAGYMTVDLYVILVVISIVRKLEGYESDAEGPELPLKTHHRSSDQRS